MASSIVREGSILVDCNGRRACKVFEIIGSVSSPYISAQPLTDRIQRIEGEKLFVGEELERRGEKGRERKHGFSKKHGNERDGEREEGRRGRGRRREGTKKFSRK